VLPDIALLYIFEFYVDGYYVEAWHALVHVCRKWRNIVFESPRRLNLRLYYKVKKQEMLDIWPALPIVIEVYVRELWSANNIIAALEHNNRICELDLSGALGSVSDKVLPALQRSFPELTRLELDCGDETTTPVQPDSFLGGSAPRMQYLFLNCIPFPGLPNLLLSATRLVVLKIQEIPLSGYISLEALVTALTVLTCLEDFELTFEPPLSFPDQKNRRLSPQARILLSSLTSFSFIGACEYLEGLIDQIDAPLLDEFTISFFPQQIFDTTRLAQFITRTPNFKAHATAHVIFCDPDALISFSQPFEGVLELGISCKQPDLLFPSLVGLFSSTFSRSFIPFVETLHILGGEYPPLEWPDDIGSNQWLELLHPFTAVKDLYIFGELVPYIARILQELVGERITEVLPVLHTLFLEKPFPLVPVQDAIRQFSNARCLAGNTVVVIYDCKF
jgi:hypothetical protein